MNRIHRFLKVLVTGLSVCLLSAAVYAGQVDDEIPVLGEETAAETEKAEAETEKTRAETEKAGAETEKAGTETEKAGTETGESEPAAEAPAVKQPRTYKIIYTVIPASVRKTQKTNVNWKSNPATYTKAESVVLKTPSLKGYVFKGWFADKAGTVRASKKIRKGSTGNKRYYAKFAPVTYTIKFDGNGLIEAPDPITCVYGKSYKLPTSKVAGFTGWNTRAGGSGTAYRPKERVKNLTVKNGKTITLYADGLTGRNNIEKLFRYFKRQGYTKQAAAAIAGNLMWESGGGYTDIKLNAVELATGRGVGMVQWTDTKDSPRRTNFVTYCKKHGYGWPNENLQLQIDFLEAELRGEYGKIWYFNPYMGYSSVYNRTLAQFKRCTNVQQAVGIFCACFERPYLRHAGLVYRVQYANYVLKNFK